MGVRRFSCADLFVLGGVALVPATLAAQSPQHRLTYDVTVVRAGIGSRQVIAAGNVSGPLETGLRFSLRSDTAEVEALFGVFSESDTVTLAAEFFAKRLLASSRRGLPLWEQDSYARFVQLEWGDTARIFPLGPPRAGAPESLWVDLVVSRSAAGGETRPAETLSLGTGPLEVVLEAVVRPRRAVVGLAVVRGRSVGPPRRFDLIPEGASRQVSLPHPRGMPLVLELGLTRPETARSSRDRTLALDADIVCLRVSQPEWVDPVGIVCGRLNNVSHRIPLPDGDTLVATFAWPGSR
jgi:hypothetical protein